MLRLYLTPGREGGPTRPRWPWSRPSLPTSNERRAPGLRMITVQLGLEPAVRADAPWLLGGVKSTSYAVNMAAEAEARRRDADDAVFLASGRIVLEGPVTNIWWRTGEELFTPGLELGILAGVTRATLIESASAARLRRARGRLPGRGARGGRRGLQLLLRPRGDAGRGARRAAVGRWRAPGRRPSASRPRSGRRRPREHLHRHVRRAAGPLGAVATTRSPACGRSTTSRETSCRSTGAGSTRTSATSSSSSTTTSATSRSPTGTRCRSSGTAPWQASRPGSTAS